MGDEGGGGPKAEARVEWFIRRMVALQGICQLISLRVFVFVCIQLQLFIEDAVRCDTAAP